MENWKFLEKVLNGKRVKMTELYMRITTAVYIKRYWN